MCGYLEVVPTVNKFLRVFHLQRLRDPDKKYNWVYFKQPKKLFAIYHDSTKHFKNWFIIVKPLTRDSNEHLFEIVDYVEDNEKKRGNSSRFPLEW